MKEQMEAIGFLVKVYRSHDKCCRALDKKAVISPMSAFVFSGCETEPMLQYLRRRGATDLRIVVDVEASSAGEAQHFITGLLHPQDSVVTLAHAWDEVLAALNSVKTEASSWVVSSTDAKVTAAAAGPPEATEASDVPWTLVWISDQAFKPAATPLKAQLEGLGCQVKGYKTHKNAARALDKKRALARTVVLVSGAEAAAFLSYLSSRPEIASTRVVVEASARAAPVRESSTCQVVEGFDAAVAAVWSIAADPNFA